jgi:hypothetical protein
MAIGQLLAWIYARKCVSDGHSEIDKAHRETASTITIGVVTLALLAWPTVWHKAPLIEGVHQTLAQNIKPRDSTGRGWLPAQTYKTPQEAKTSRQVFATMHRALLSILLGLLSGVAAGALVKALGPAMRGDRPAYRPRSGPFQNNS